MPRSGILSNRNNFREGDEPSPVPSLRAAVCRLDQVFLQAQNGCACAAWDLDWSRGPLAGQSLSASHHEWTDPGEAARPRALGHSPVSRHRSGLWALGSPGV